MRNRKIDHKAVAERLRKAPGQWLPVGVYGSQYSATTAAWHLRMAGGRCAKFGHVYGPAGAFDTRVERDADGEPLLMACYLGEPAREAA